uniref:Glycosyltransferase-like protein LARGE2 n=1 Tax=Heterosigma akashiwo TaxID=2829 RepID=A0A7S3XSG1_HETAK
MNLKTLFSIVFVPAFFIGAPFVFLSTFKGGLLSSEDPTLDNVPQLVDAGKEAHISIKEFEDSTGGQSEESGFKVENSNNAELENSNSNQVRVLDVNPEKSSSTATDEESASEANTTADDAEADAEADAADNGGESEQEEDPPDNYESGEIDLAPNLGTNNFTEAFGGPIDFTLATQTTVDRAWLLGEWCRRWEGPLVAVVGGSRVNATAVDLLRAEEACGDRLTIVENYNAKGKQYPVNKLRNIAIRQVKTSHFILLDIDFMPSKGMYITLLKMASQEQSKTVLESAKNAIVVPAFTLRSECGSQEVCSKRLKEVPATSLELSKCLGTRKCWIFDYHNPAGHSTTDYNKWQKQEESSLREISCFKSNRYEPYFILRKHPVLPLYDERFVGYGKNKIQHVLHLRYAGYTFRVLGKHFVVHAPHPKSNSRRAWEKSNHRKNMDGLFAKFLHRLQEESNNVVTHLCAFSSAASTKKKKKHR